METYQYIPVSSERMFVGLHMPQSFPGPQNRGASAQHGLGEGASGCVVLASPIHEEKKSAHRPLVDLARALARRGVPCLRFDYIGTGDSSGDRSRVTLSTMREDLAVALEHALKVTNASVARLIGLRLGADVAALLAETDPRVVSLVLAVPIVQGVRYVREMRVRSRIRGALTQSAGGTAGLAGAVGEDFDGHPVSDELIRELEAHDLGARTGSLGASVLCLDVRGRAEPTAGLVKLGEALRARGADVTVSAVVDDPFWNALGPVEPRAFIDAVVEHICRGAGTK